MTDALPITVRVTNEVDVDGHYMARVYEDGKYSRSFCESDRQVALDKALAYARWLREHDDTEEEIVL